MGMNLCCVLILLPGRTPSYSRGMSRLCHRDDSAVASFGVDQVTSSNMPLNILKQLSNVTSKLSELVKVDEGVDARTDARRS